MKRVCTLCGCSCYKMYAFKNGHVCEDCLQYLKADTQVSGQVRINH